jgi:hypothetical protein
MQLLPLVHFSGSSEKVNDVKESPNAAGGGIEPTAVTQGNVPEADIPHGQI